MADQPYRQAIESYIAQEAKPIDKYSHQMRLYRLSTQIGEGLNYDDDIVHAAVWLHDLGVFIGHRPEDPAELSRWDNVAYAAERTPELLATWGFPPTKIAAVVAAIRTHLPSAEPQSIEATILRDADILEQLGAVAVLRTVSKVGRDTRFHTFEDALRVLQRQLDTLPAQLRLAKTQELALPRIAALRDFLSAATYELGG